MIQKEVKVDLAILGFNKEDILWEEKLKEKGK